jgi:chorismate mutase/prephenate dehydratase
MMKILIYGVGEMGKFFRDFFYSKGYYVKGFDILKERSEINSDEISDFDVIFICVPMDSLSEALNFISERVSDNPLLVDISSIKSVSLPLFDSLNYDYLSIHPMFGRDSEIGLSNIIIVHESGREEEKIILKEFESSGAVLSRISREEHDRKMAEVQGISHFMLVALADFLRFREEDMVYASPIFSVLYKLASRIINQDWRMYYIIQKNAEELRERFVERTRELHETLKDRDKFENLFMDLRKIYRDYQNSTLILDAYKATKDAEELEQLRGYIRAIDSLILRLIERRIEAGRRIALKKRESDKPIEVSDVEEAKIKDLLTKTSLNPIGINAIFEKIIHLTKEEEYRVLGLRKNVAVLGPAGSFSEEIALKLVGSRLPLRYCFNTDEIIKLVESSEVDFGIIPIENSINGTVLPVLDALMNHEVEVFGEARLEIKHCLAAKRKLEMKDIKVVYSHPQAIAQCTGFINNYLPHAEIRYTSSTSDAAKMLDDYSAAILSENAARFYRLYILRKGIQDLKARNITRFYIIRRKGGERRGKITSLFFGVEDRPGALKDVLEVFYSKGINLRKLESRPAGTGLGDYVFFVEVEAPLKEGDLEDLKNVTTFYKLVGVFDEISKLDIYS